MTKTSSQSAPQSDIPSAFAELSEKETRQFFKDLAQRVRYADYAHISIDAFRRHVNLAVLDRWTDYEDGDKAERLNLEPEVLDSYREAPEYKEIRAALEREFEFLAQPRTLKEHVADDLTQDRLAKRTIRIGLHAKDPRDSIKALQQMNDRAMPAIQRETETRIVMIRSEDLHLFEKVQKELSEYDQTLIDGEVVEGGESTGDSEDQPADAS